ncbi:MAG: hypothetical protein KDD67_11545 [Ignavibacteriae bacterium]|nr:hypothetical protein [Ignavibacteriota bacterium]MCB9216573.1 hypothetical protein [Ignavibacteria bacterium]
MTAHVLLEVNKLTAKFNQESLIANLRTILEEIAKLSAKKNVQVELEINLKGVPDNNIVRFAEIFANAANPVQAEYGNIWKYVSFTEGTLWSTIYLFEMRMNPLQTAPVVEKSDLQIIEDLVGAL